MGRRLLSALAIGTTGVAGLVLASGALAPVVSALLPGPAPAPPQLQPVSAWTPQGSVSDWAGDTWMDGDSRPEWSGARSAAGPQRPSSPSLPSRPAVQVPENPRRFIHGGVPPNQFQLHLQARPSCFQQRGPGATVKSFAVQPGKASASVSWWDLGDPDTRSYTLTAVPTGGGRGVVVSRPVAAPGTCTTVRTTVRGLVSGQTYRFWLTAENRSPVNGRDYRPTRGQSDSFVVL